MAQKAGFGPIKINAVSIRGVTEHEVLPLARFGREHGLEIRFIEYMPIGDDHWERDKVYFAHEIVQQSEKPVRPADPGQKRRSPQPGHGVYLRGRRRSGRHHRLHLQAVLHELQSARLRPMANAATACSRWKKPTSRAAARDRRRPSR